MPTKGIVLFQGPMAAGKTLMITEIVRKIHAKSEYNLVSSPTFAMHRRYSGKPDIEHWDLYRIKNEEDLETSGFWDQFSDDHGLILVEWSERLNYEWLPTNESLFIIEISGEDSKRQILFKKRI